MILGAVRRILTFVIPGKRCKRALCVKTDIIFFLFKLYKVRHVKTLSFLLQEQGCVTVSVKKLLFLGCKKIPILLRQYGFVTASVNHCLVVKSLAS